MRDFLLFRLYGPLAAWGDIAVGENRPSQHHPTRSAIQGLLAAALGLARDDEDAQVALSQCFGLGLRLDASGSLLRDYHTTQVPPDVKGQVARSRREELGGPKLSTILSAREYREDAFYTVALWSQAKANWSLKDLSEALRRPRWLPYLGRKSCALALPMRPVLCSAETLREAFAAYPASDSLLVELGLGARFFDAKPRVFWEGLSDAEAGYHGALETTRHDRVLSRSRWQFGDRVEFAAIGGDA